MKKVLTYFVGLLLTILLFSLYISVLDSMPNNAILLASKESKTYYSPVYISDCKDFDFVNASKLTPITSDEAHKLKYNPDPDCRDKGYFMGEDRSLLKSFLQSAGILKKNSRWNEDGTWNW